MVTFAGDNSVKISVSLESNKPDEACAEVDFITCAVKRCNISVSWHLATSSRTMNQKNLPNIASGTAEGAFLWLRALPRISGGCVWVCTRGVGKHLISCSEHPLLPTEMKETESKLQVRSHKLDCLLCCSCSFSWCFVGAVRY